MPPRVMVSTDIGNINSVANSYLRFEEPRSFFAPMSFGNCGYALPTIIGAKVAAPRPPGHRLRRRRRLGHEHGRDHDLRAPRHPGHRRGLPQPPVGRGEEEPGRLLQPPLRRRRAGQPELRRHRPGDGRRGHRRRQARGRGPGAQEGDRPADEPGQDLRHRDHVHPRTGRPLPPRRAGQAGALPGEVQGLGAVVRRHAGAACRRRPSACPASRCTTRWPTRPRAQPTRSSAPPATCARAAAASACTCAMAQCATSTATRTTR